MTSAAPDRKPEEFAAPYPTPMYEPAPNAATSTSIVPPQYPQQIANPTAAAMYPPQAGQMVNTVYPGQQPPYPGQQPAYPGQAPYPSAGQQQPQFPMGMPSLSTHHINVIKMLARTTFLIVFGIFFCFPGIVLTAMGNSDHMSHWESDAKLVCIHIMYTECTECAECLNSF